MLAITHRKCSLQISRTAKAQDSKMITPSKVTNSEYKVAIYTEKKTELPQKVTH